MPEFDRTDTLQWMGVFSPHSCGWRAERFCSSPAADIEPLVRIARLSARGQLAAADLRRVEQRRRSRTRQRGACYDAQAACARSACTATATPARVVTNPPALRRFRRQPHGRRYRSVDAAVGRTRRTQAQFNEILTGYEDFAEFDPRELKPGRGTQNLAPDHYAAWLHRRWTTGFSAAFPGSIRSNTAGADPRIARADCLDGRAAAGGVIAQRQPLCFDVTPVTGKLAAHVRRQFPDSTLKPFHMIPATTNLSLLPPRPKRIIAEDELTVSTRRAFRFRRSHCHHPAPAFRHPV